MTKTALILAAIAALATSGANAAKPEAKPEVARTNQPQPQVAAKPEARPEVAVKAPQGQPQQTMSAKPEAKPE